MVKRLFIIITLISLLQTANCQAVSQNFEIAKNTEIFNLILKELSTGYIDNIQPGDLTHTAIVAMLDQLDPYTNYITDNDIDEYRFMTTGEYGGTGIQTAIRKDTTIVIHLDPSGPAIRSTLKPGDKIIKIDGRFIFGFQHYIPVKDNDLFQDRTFLLYFICVIVLELLTYKYHL